MRKLRVWVLGGVLAPTTLCAQNCVPNWSFEVITSCPHDEDQLEHATGWSDHLGTPDLYNVCDGTDTAGVPANWAGFQVPANGSGYAGIIAYGSGGNYHEIAGAQLTSSLEIGAAYYMSVRFSWTPVAGTFKYANNNLGLMLRTQPLMDLEWLPWPNNAHVYSTDVISDSVGWTTVQGVVVADSGYQYVFVGNFFDDALTTAELVNPGAQYGMSYYYVDEVCVVPLGGDCGVPSTIGSLAHQRSFTVRPVPFEEEIVIDGSFQGDVGVEILSALGTPVHRTEISARTGSIVLGLPGLASGPYVLRVVNQERELHRQLIVRR